MVDGKLFYSEGDQAWTKLRLKKEVLHEFPQLKNKRISFKYRMIIPRSPDKIEEFMEEFSKSSNMIPVLLFFSKSEVEE